MKKLTPAEFATYEVKEKKNLSACARELREVGQTLEVGEYALVLKSEWTNKTAPYLKFEGRKFGTKALVNEAGWIVGRTV